MIDPNRLSSVGSGANADGLFPSNAPWTLRRLSRTYSDWVLAETFGNTERAAQILGSDLSTLYRWQLARLD
jgi:hypothetical protein